MNILNANKIFALVIILFLFSQAVIFLLIKFKIMTPFENFQNSYFIILLMLS